MRNIIRIISSVVMFFMAIGLMASLSAGPGVRVIDVTAKEQAFVIMYVFVIVILATLLFLDGLKDD